MEAVSALTIVAISIFLYMSAWGAYAIYKRRRDVADIAWGPGFALAGWTAYLGSPSTPGLFANCLVTVWAIRLFIHIVLRNRQRAEDFRYRQIKQNPLSIYFKVFLLQGLLLYIIALPLIWIQSHPPSSALFWLAFPIWVAGFTIEAIGDYQLLRFLNDPTNQGKLLTSGLWSYVRHPNYLGEIAQWWAIWLLSSYWPLMISPILITFLIVRVSGIAPLEEKMKNNPDFASYAKKTPCLIPPTLINGALYSAAWLVIIVYGTQRSFLIPIIAALLSAALQLSLFYKEDRKILNIMPPLILTALVLGISQETILIHSKVIEYKQPGLFAPFWILILYPLFSLTLNSSLSWINKNWLAAFIFGGAGALLSYLTGEKLHAVHLRSPMGAFVSWGCFLVLLTWQNRKLSALQAQYTDPQKLSEKLIVFFDDQCPICSREMNSLKKRLQTGLIEYATPHDDGELREWTSKFTYRDAMRKIHGLTADGTVLTGIDVLAALYARTNLPYLSILLEAPGFRILSQFLYFLWSKFRIRN